MKRKLKDIYSSLQTITPLQQAYGIIILSLLVQYSINFLVYFDLFPNIGDRSLNGFLKNNSYVFPALLGLIGSFVFWGKEGFFNLLRPYAKLPKNPLWWLLAIGILTPVVYTSLLFNDLIYGNTLMAYAIKPPTTSEFMRWAPLFIQVAVCDEIFWIGYVYPRLTQAGYSSEKASMAIGILWGMDYLPFLFTGFFVSPGLTGVSILLGFLSLAPIYIWLYEKTKSALVPVAFNVSMQFTFSAIPVLPHVTGDNAAVSMANLLCFLTGLALWYFYPCKNRKAKPQYHLSNVTGAT